MSTQQEKKGEPNQLDKAQEIVQNYEELKNRIENQKSVIGNLKNEMVNIKRPLLFGKDRYEQQINLIKDKITSEEKILLQLQEDLSSLKDDYKKSYTMLKKHEKEELDRLKKERVDELQKVLDKLCFQVKHKTINSEEKKDQILKAWTYLLQSLSNNSEELIDFMELNEQQISVISLLTLIEGVNPDEIVSKDEINTHNKLIRLLADEFVGYSLPDIWAGIKEVEDRMFSYDVLTKNIKAYKDYLNIEQEVIIRMCLSEAIKAKLRTIGDENKGKSILLKIVLVAQNERILNIVNDDSFAPIKHGDIVRPYKELASGLLKIAVEKKMLTVINDEFYVLDIADVPAKLSQFVDFL